MVTLRERMALALISKGFDRVEHGSGKYWAFEHAKFGPNKRVFLGKSGSARLGRISTQSRPIADHDEADSA